jgi:hypothetical protein
MKGLKTRKDSDALAYQRKLPKHILAKAKQLGLPQVITKKLSLKRGAADTAIAKAIEDHNKSYERLVRCLEETDFGVTDRQKWEEFAEVYIDAKGFKRGALVGVDSLDGPFDDVIDGVFGTHQHQDHYNYDEQYGDDRIPPKLVDAVMAILNTPVGERTFHLFSHAVEAYTAFRLARIENTAVSETQRRRMHRDWKKDAARLNDFMVFSGNQEFTTENCNTCLTRYRKHLVNTSNTPSTANRHLEVPAAALRYYAAEEVESVVVGPQIIRGQKAASKKTPVLDVSRELPLIWEAAHDPANDHFVRLSIFGIFSGAGASELVQTEVEDVYPEDGYFVLGGTKQPHRCRPAIILNDTHRELLMFYRQGSIAGPKRAMQTEANHSKVLKEALQRITGNDALIPYSYRHTGKHLADIKGYGGSDDLRLAFGWKNGKTNSISDEYGKAGLFAAPLIARLRHIMDCLLEDLPDHDNPPAVSRGNVVRFER